jgi:hypothetical protein
LTVLYLHWSHSYLFSACQSLRSSFTEETMHSLWSTSIRSENGMQKLQEYSLLQQVTHQLNHKFVKKKIKNSIWPQFIVSPSFCQAYVQFAHQQPLDAEIHTPIRLTGRELTHILFNFKTFHLITMSTVILSHIVHMGGIHSIPYGSHSMVLWLFYQADCGGNLCIDYTVLIPSFSLKEDTIDAINAAKGSESMRHWLCWPFISHVLLWTADIYGTSYMLTHRHFDILSYKWPL